MGIVWVENYAYEYAAKFLHDKEVTFEATRPDRGSSRVRLEFPKLSQKMSELLMTKICHKSRQYAKLEQKLCSLEQSCKKWQNIPEA